MQICDHVRWHSVFEFEQNQKNIRNDLFIVLIQRLFLRNPSCANTVGAVAISEPAIRIAIEACISRHVLRL